MTSPGSHQQPLLNPAAQHIIGVTERLMAPRQPLLTPDERKAAEDLAQRKMGCTLCVLPGAYIGSRVPALIENVLLGDELLMPDGSAGRAENVATHHYNGEVKTIHARSMLPLTVTEDHLLLVFPALYDRPSRSGWQWRQRRAPENERPVWRTAADVRPGDYVVCPIPQIEGPEPPHRWASTDACWLLGMLAGDGHTAGRDGKRYYVGLTMGLRKPVDEATRVLQDMGYRVKTTIVNGPVAPLAKMLVCSRDLAEDVYALLGDKAPRKHLPPFVWSSKDRLRAALDGLLATDGCRLVRDGIVRYDFCTTSIALAWQVWYAALALGERPFIHAVNRRSGYPNASPSWRVRWVDGPRMCFTARTDEFYAMPITKILTADYEGPVHDITASPEPVFVANGVTTHNCGALHPLPSTPACPRLATFTVDADGKVTGGTFWAEWDTSRVVFLADAAEEPEGSDDRA